MTGKAVSYQFLDVLAKSVGMDAETVKQALVEINQLQQQTNQLQRQTQALELAVQGQATTNHASQQPIFGTADEQMHGHVKTSHEVTSDSTSGAAVSPDAAYAYAPNRDATPLGIVTRTKADIFDSGELYSDAAYAQISGNAVTIGWGDSSYQGINRVEVLIPAIYKFENFADYQTCTNSGIKVTVTYGLDGILSVQMAEPSKAFDSILILMSPKNV